MKNKGKFEEEEEEMNTKTRRHEEVGRPNMNTKTRRHEEERPKMEVERSELKIGLSQIPMHIGNGRRKKEPSLRGGTTKQSVDYQVEERRKKEEFEGLTIV